MKYIDAHLHLDAKFSDLKEALKILQKELKEAQVSRALLLHLEFQNWKAKDLAAELKKTPEIKAFINVNPTDPKAKEKLKAGIAMGFIGLKLHPRLQEYKVSNPKVAKLVKYAGELKVPVLIDAFPDGTYLLDGFQTLDFAKLAKACPKTKIIWAHMGGQHVLDFMMLAKRLPNVYMDCSYSLLYFRGSAIPQNMVYAMRSMKFDRIFYGSDYPDRSVKETLHASLKIFRDMGMSEEEINKVVFTNAKDFFGWDDL